MRPLPLYISLSFSELLTYVIFVHAVTLSELSMRWTQMITQILKPVDERCVITLIRIISPDNVKHGGGESH